MFVIKTTIITGIMVRIMLFDAPVFIAGLIALLPSPMMLC